MNLKLSAEEQEQLTRIVDSYYAALRSEVHRTDNHDLKDRLAAEEKLVASLLKRIQELS